ncbi:MAG: Crp/Fnr family transcriptional regulator [Vicinamibacterales bacterium]
MTHGIHTARHTDAAATPACTNAVLRRLPDEERRQLLAASVPIHLARRQVLQEAGSPLAVVLFPVTCVISLHATTEEGATVEVAMLGHEGVIGFPIGHDTPESPYTLTVRVAGHAIRVRPDVLRRAFDQSPAVRRVLLDHWHALLAEVVRGSACHYFHTGLQRFAGWLLTASSRGRVGTLEVTHEDVGHMLGIPRSAATAGAMALRHAGAIRYHQGHVTILDRRRLRAFACDCHRDSPSLGS